MASVQFPQCSSHPSCPAVVPHESICPVKSKQNKRPRLPGNNIESQMPLVRGGYSVINAAAAARDIERASVWAFSFSDGGQSFDR